MTKSSQNLGSLLFVFVAVSFTTTVDAQLSFSGQLRTRSEFRNGFGTLKAKSADPAFFTSQRTRLTFNYKSGKLIFHTAMQDVRVWGQDASTINNSDGNRLSVHEAWTELIVFNKNDTAFKNRSGPNYLGIKLGRQELVYDDSRLLGNLDWLQQGRRHDAVVLKLLTKKWQVDLGSAFNQHTDAVNYNGTYYTPANVQPFVKDSKGNLTNTPAGMIPTTNQSGWSSKSGTPFLTAIPSTNGLYQDYKAMQFLYVARVVGQFKISGLLLADHFGKNSADSVRNIAGADTGYVYGRRFNRKGVNSRFTTGILMNGHFDNKKLVAFTAGAYYQAGHDRDAQQLSAYTTTVSIAYTRRQLTWTAGWDYVSGNNGFSQSGTNQRFDPLYGTPHKFWGFMDYFYVGTGTPAGGLSNVFLKSKYTGKNKRLTTSLDLHYFSLANKQADASGLSLKKYLGTEIDLVSNYSLNKFASLEYGFSVMAGSKSMEYAKNIAPGTSRLTATWSYLSLNIAPTFLFK